VRKPQQDVGGWYASTKLDGERAIWVPPTAGIIKEEVPFANRPTSWRARDAGHVATGLWTRNGNIIHAPSAFLSQLPPFPVDLELYAGVGTFQSLRSIVSTFEPDVAAWDGVSACIIDAVDMHEFLKPALIRTRQAVIAIDASAYQWWCKQDCKSVSPGKPFIQRLEWLHQWVRETDRCVVVPQRRLDFNSFMAERQLEEFFDQALEDGDEGIVVRSGAATYTCARTHQMLKITPKLDDEGVVMGYVWGLAPDNRRSMAGTAYGVRLGAMGGMWLRWRDKEFVLSGTGFKMEESYMVYADTRQCAADEGILHPGTEVAGNIINPTFPRGSRVTFTYRTLSDDGFPIAARYRRKRD
jgi:hypothetical protein